MDPVIYINIRDNTYKFESEKKIKNERTFSDNSSVRKVD